MESLKLNAISNRNWPSTSSPPFLYVRLVKIRPTELYFSFRWSGFEECLVDLLKWLTEVDSSLSTEPQLKSTLDEKRTQLAKYRTILNNAVLRNPDIMKLRTMFDALPQRDDDLKQKLNSVIAKYDLIVKQSQVLHLTSEFNATSCSVQLTARTILYRTWLRSTRASWVIISIIPRQWWRCKNGWTPPTTRSFCGAI